MNEAAVPVDGDAEASPHTVDLEAEHPVAALGDGDLRRLAADLHFEMPGAGRDVAHLDRLGCRFGAELVRDVLRAPAVVAPARRNTGRQGSLAATALVGVERGGDRVQALGGRVSRRAARRGRQVSLDEVRVELPGLEGGVLEHGDQEVAVGGDAAHAQPAQRSDQASDRLAAAGAHGDELGEQRIVVDADLAAGGDAAVDAHAGKFRRLPQRDPPRRRQEVVGRVLGVETRLDGVSAQGQLFLGER